MFISSPIVHHHHCKLVGQTHIFTQEHIFQYGFLYLPVCRAELSKTTCRRSASPVAGQPNSVPAPFSCSEHINAIYVYNQIPYSSGIYKVEDISLSIHINISPPKCRLPQLPSSMAVCHSTGSSAYMQERWKRVESVADL